MTTNKAMLTCTRRLGSSKNECRGLSCFRFTRYARYQRDKAHVQTPTSGSAVCVCVCMRVILPDRYRLKLELHVPFDLLGKTEECHSSKQASVPLLGALQRHTCHPGQSCLWADPETLLVQATCGLQSLRRRGRPICVFLEFS